MKTNFIKEAIKLMATLPPLAWIGPEEMYELDIEGELDNDAWQLAAESSINVLSDKDLLVSVVDENAGLVVGAVFNSYRPSDDEYSFDIVVHPDYQRQGLGKQLIDYAIQDYYQYDEAVLKLDVVNPALVPLLEREYGLKVLETVGDHIIMGE